MSNTVTPTDPPSQKRHATKGEAPKQVRALQGFYEIPQQIKSKGHSHDRG